MSVLKNARQRDLTFEGRFPIKKRDQYIIPLFTKKETEIGKPVVAGKQSTNGCCGHYGCCSKELLFTRVLLHQHVYT